MSAQKETGLPIDLKFNRKINKKFEMIERKESFKEKFMEFKKSKVQTEMVVMNNTKSDEAPEAEDSLAELDQTEKNMMPFRPVAYNLAYFANDSIVLQKFIDMGVMIRKWDKDRSICEFVLKVSFNYVFIMFYEKKI